ncbi:MAG: sugar transferase [Chloroflexota bacterium]|nr:sugar transferase [Chloroflexota bacterium]
MDIALSVMLLILFTPVFIILSILVAWQHGFPILFRQKRPGFHGEIFTIYKFRTMRDLVDDQGILLPDAKRLTKLGRFLRIFSLDELPELINILKGEMSFVGPRPLLIAYLHLYSAQQFRRHDVLPGLTGWAQVHGRNVLTWQEKFDLDVWYVDHWSLWLDIKIIGTTIGKVLKQEGISQPGKATAEPFTGNPPETDQPIKVSSSD